MPIAAYAAVGASIPAEACSAIQHAIATLWNWSEIGINIGQILEDNNLTFCRGKLR